MTKVATKTQEDRLDEEADRLVRPSPKDKPPRHDKRRERIKVDDPDLDQRDPDLSLNRKDIGGAVEAMNGYPDPEKLPKPPKLPKLAPLPKLDPIPKPPKLDPVPKPRPSQEKVEREDYDQEFWAKVAPYLTDLVRGNPSFFDYLKARFTEPKRKTTDLLSVRDTLVPSYIKTYGHLKEWVQQAGGLDTLEKAVSLPPKSNLKNPVQGQPEKKESVVEPVEPEPISIYLEPPQRSSFSYEDRQKAVLTLVKYLKPSVAVRYATSHPQDLATLLSSYKSYKEAKKESFSYDPPSWVHFDPKMVPPWTGTVLSSSGIIYPIRLLSEQEQREFQQSHRYRVVGASLAWRDLWVGRMRDLGVSSKALRKFDASYRGAVVPSEFFKEGSTTPGNPPDLTFLKDVGNPGFKSALIHYGRGRVLAHLSNKFLKSGESPITEYDTPGDIARKIVQAWDESETYSHLTFDSMEPLGVTFARKVLKGLRKYAPDKVKPVVEAVQEKKPLFSYMEPEEDNLRWAEELESSYTEAKSSPSMPQPSKTALYHGLPPEKVHTPYQEWSQGRVWEMTASEKEGILSEAKTWQRNPSLKGLPADSLVRSSLDHALKSYLQGKYAGGLPPQMYNEMLADLGHQDPSKPLLTLRESSVKMAKHVQASAILRKLSNKLSSGEINSTEAAMDLALAADEVQQSEQEPSKQAEQQAQPSQESQQVQQMQQQVQAYAKLKSDVIRLASSNPAAKSVLLPILRTIKEGLSPNVPQRRH